MSVPRFSMPFSTRTSVSFSELMTLGTQENRRGNSLHRVTVLACFRLNFFTEPSYQRVRVNATLNPPELHEPRRGDSPGVTDPEGQFFCLGLDLFFTERDFHLFRLSTVAQYASQFFWPSAVLGRG